MSELKNQIENLEKDIKALIANRKSLKEEMKRIRWRDVCDDTEHKHNGTKLENHDIEPEYHDNGNVRKTKV